MIQFIIFYQLIDRDENRLTLTIETDVCDKINRCPFVIILIESHLPFEDKGFEGIGDI